MKRLIFLKVVDVNPDDKKIKKTDLTVLEQKAVADSIRTFKSGLINTGMKFLSQVGEEPQVLVEFADAQMELAYDQLRRMEIVELIDSILPKSE